MLDPSELQVLLKTLDADSESDAAFALKSLKAVLTQEGLTFSALIGFALKHIGEIKRATIDAAPQPKKAPAMQMRDIVQPAGMPDCRVQGKGGLFLSGGGKGEVIALPGAAQDSAEDIAMGMKDALAAAILNKTRFKIKLTDVKNTRGEVAHTLLRAEYERDGMAPVSIWSGVRGEAAVLATVLRTALKSQVGHLVQP